MYRAQNGGWGEISYLYGVEGHRHLWSRGAQKDCPSGNCPLRRCPFGNCPFSDPKQQSKVLHPGWKKGTVKRKKRR